MQAFIGHGINYYYVDIRLLTGYTYGDTISVQLSKDGCQARYFNAETPSEPCDNRLMIVININQCIDETGTWNISIENLAKEIIYNNIIQIQKNLI